MSSIQIIIFIGIILVGFLLVVLLRKSRRKKGPLVSGEESMAVGDNADGL